MLILSRYKNEDVIIGDDIVIRVIDIQGSRVRLGFEAPENVSIHRREVYELIKRKEEDGYNS